MSRILVDITHPADVHFFRHAIGNWQRAGHTLLISARNKDVIHALLRDFCKPFVPVGMAGAGVLGLARELVIREFAMFRLMRRFKPDVVCAFGGTFVVHATKILNIPSVIFYDTDAAKVANAITFPFASVVATPDFYPDDLGKKHRRFAGYKETAYMHPDYFSPDPGVITRYGIDPQEPFSFVRLSSWDASHDFDHHGIRSIREALERLAAFGRVLVSVEGDRTLPDDLEVMRYRGSVIDAHHFMAFARLVMGEGATTAAEAGLLGVPSIYISTLGRVATDDLERRYGLVFTFTDPELGQKQGLQKAEALLSDPQTPALWREKRRRMLADQQDVTRYVTDLVLEYA